MKESKLLFIYGLFSLILCFPILTHMFVTGQNHIAVLALMFSLCAIFVNLSLRCELMEKGILKGKKSKSLRYYWKFYIKPILLGISPNSPEGLRIRAEKIEEDSKNES